MAKRRMAGQKLKDSLTPNKPRKTPGHPTKSHVVLAKEGGKEKLIRFGQQGVKGAGVLDKTNQNQESWTKYIGGEAWSVSRACEQIKTVHKVGSFEQSIVCVVAPLGPANSTSCSCGGRMRRARRTERLA